MLSSGDVQGHLRKLEALLRVIKYPGYVDYNGLSKGDPSAFLPIVSFTLTSFSPPFAEQLAETGFELTGKSDLRFIDTVYKVLRDVLQYKPKLTKQQFLQWGFSQWKISVTCDIINLVLQKHNQTKKSRDRCLASHSDGREAHPTLTEENTVNHTGNASTSPMSTHVEAFHSDSPRSGRTELGGRQEHKDNVLQSRDRCLASHSDGREAHPTLTEENTSSKVEERLSALEAQLESLSGLHRLDVLERRLDELERQRNTETNDGQFITVSRQSWENLLSRVFLLETKIQLSNTKAEEHVKSSEELNPPQYPGDEL